MPKALTLEHRSLGLAQGVETSSHESHRRKSRMVAISWSGSGEQLAGFVELEQRALLKGFRSVELKELLPVVGTLA